MCICAYNINMSLCLCMSVCLCVSVCVPVCVCLSVFQSVSVCLLACLCQYVRYLVYLMSAVEQVSLDAHFFVYLRLQRNGRKFITSADE